MKSIFIYNQKGGIGKTTIAITLAHGLTIQGYKVAIIDLDEQQSTKKFLNYSNIFNIDCFTSTNKLSQNDLNDLTDYDYVILDTSPRLSVEMAKSMSFCNVVLIPVVANQLDFWASDYTRDLYLDIKKINKKLKAYYVINKALSTGNELNELIEVLGNDKKVPILATIKQRKAYALTINKTVYESKNRVAIDEFNNFISNLTRSI